MESHTLKATKRQALGTRATRRLRGDGLLPAVLYGHQRDTVHLAVPLKEFEHLFHAGVRLVALEIGGTQEPALIKDLQHDSMGDHIVHADFIRVSMDETVTVTVPVELHGLAIGTTHGGVLDHILVDLEVECLPADIPECIRIEVGDLDVNGIIHVKDITPPPGCVLVPDPESPVVMVHPPLHAEAEVAAEGEGEAAEAGAEPEVIGRPQDDDEGNEG